MSFRVHVLARAERELDAILVWLVRRSPQGAARWLAAFEDAKDRLASNPLLCGLAPENDFVDAEIRQAIFKTRRGRRYRALFTIIGEEVRILHIRGPGQRLLTRRELGLN